MKRSGAGSSAWILQLSAPGSQAASALAMKDVVHRVPVLVCVLFSHITVPILLGNLLLIHFLIRWEMARIVCARLCMENPARELSAQLQPTDKGSHLGKWQRRDTWGC